HRERQVVEVFVMLPPGQVHELGVRARGQDLRVAILELAIEVAKALDLRGAHEGEVLGIEENDQPFALVRVVVDVDEGGLDVRRDRRLEIELGELLSDSEHVSYPFGPVFGAASYFNYRPPGPIYEFDCFY